MNIFKQFMNYRKALKKAKKIQKIIKSNSALENETKLIINNLKVNVELLVNKFPELQEVYFDCLEVLNND